jgi:hypothetical protein
MTKMRFRVVLMITIAVLTFLIGCKKKPHKVSKLEPDTYTECLQDYTITGDGIDTRGLEDMYPDRIEREYIRLKLTQKVYFI